MQIMDPQMHLRPYTEQDLPEMMQLFTQTIHHINKRDYTPAQLQAWAPGLYDMDKLHARMAPCHSLLACAGHTITGFATLSPDGLLDFMYVHHLRQGQGIAGALLRALEAHARLAGMQSLRTEASITARPFFEKHGFKVLAPQHKMHNGLEFLNFKMNKQLL